jgi:acyl carrier protein
MNTEQKLKEIFNTILNKNKIFDYNKLEINKTKNWDSLKHLNLIILLEEEFSIKITPDDMQELTNYKKILSFLNSKN